MELHPKLSRQLKERLNEFQKQGGDIWSQIVLIVETLGEREVVQGSGHTTVSCKLDFEHGSNRCHLHKSNYAMGGDYIDVQVNGKVVLNVGERSNDFPDRATIADKARSVKIGEQWYLVETYIPGPWEKWLDLAQIKKQLDDKKAGIRRTATIQRQKEEEERPFTEDEEKIARNFDFLTF